MNYKMAGWFEIAANRRALAYILFSAVMLGVIITAGILPVRNQTEQARRDARAVEASIREQEIFHPLYRRLKEKAENAGDQESAKQAGAGGPEESFTIDNAAEILESMAKSAGMENYSFSPAPASVEKQESRLLVRCSLSGRYDNFRQFLTGLATAPGFESLELLEARSGAKHPEYSIRIWLSIK